MGVGAAGWSHLAVFAVFLPYAAVKSSFKLNSRPFPPKVAHFTSQILVLMVFCCVSAIVANVESVVVFPRERPEARMAVLGGAVLVALIVLMRPLWRKRVAERSRRVWLFMPRTGQERLLWGGCSLAAGVSEEVTYRGVMFALLWRVTGSALAAALLTALVFAVSHFMQGWRSMAIIGAMALTFQLIAWVSGSLYVGMAVHALYDLAAGLFYGRYGEELGYPVEAMPPPEATAAV